MAGAGKGPRGPREAGRLAQVGCVVHGTPAGEVCDGCVCQGELFCRVEVVEQTQLGWRAEEGS